MLRNSKVIVLGCSHSELAIIHALKNCGVSLIGVGNLKTALGRDICDEFHEFDYTDHLQLGTLARKVDASFIVSASNDYGFFAALKVSAELGLCGYDSNEAAEAIHYKDKFKVLLERLKIPTPKRIFSGSISELAGAWPDLRATLSPQKKYLFKPVDQGSGKGIVEIKGSSDVTEFSKSLGSISRSDACIVEEYVTGTLHGYSAFIKEGQIIEDFMADEWLRDNELLVDCSCYPSGLEDRVGKGLAEATRKMVLELGLVDGLIHHQFIFDGKNYFLLETTRRNPGDLFGEQITLCDGKDYAKLLISTQFGIRLDHVEDAFEVKLGVLRKSYWSDESPDKDTFPQSNAIRAYDLTNQYPTEAHPKRKSVVFFQKTK